MVRLTQGQAQYLVNMLQHDQREVYGVDGATTERQSMIQLL